VQAMQVGCPHFVAHVFAAQVPQCVLQVPQFVAQVWHVWQVPQFVAHVLHVWQVPQFVKMQVWAQLVLAVGGLH
jgi:hypothetical protein